MKVQLTHSKSSRERYYLIQGQMGSAGESRNHVNHHAEIANGIDRGNGYQGYMAVSYFLKLEYIPQSAKNIVINFCKKNNYSYL